MAEYYTGHDAIIRFDVYKDGKPFRPRDAIVAVYGPNRKFIEESVAQVKGSEVMFVLRGEKIERSGTYIFVFRVSINQMADHTHVVDIKVEDLPVKQRETKVKEIHSGGVYGK